MTACEIQRYTSPIMDSYGRIAANGPSTVQARCKTHSWNWQPGIEPASTDDNRCPLGRIEEATDAALMQVAGEVRRWLAQAAHLHYFAGCTSKGDDVLGYTSTGMERTDEGAMPEKSPLKMIQEATEEALRKIAEAQGGKG